MDKSNTQPFDGTDRFEVQRCIGKGSMGRVYQVFDRKKGAIVALKTLLDNDGGALYRFKQEFRNLADITHPNLVTLHEMWGEDERWFFTMDLVDGVDFFTYVRGAVDADAPDRGPLTAVSADELADNPYAHLLGPLAPPPDIPRLRDALRQLAEGVAALHRAGKLHRDIKPSNVLVTRDGHVVVLDFGLVLDVAKGNSTPHLFAGTAVYASPEQAARQALTPASDWYSVGVMLYQALTGRLPFDGPPLRVLMVKQKFDPVPPVELLTDLPEDLSNLCAQLLSRWPEDRPDGDAVLRRLGTRPDSLPYVSSAPSADYPFIGRASQLAELDDALSELRTARPVAVFLRGSSGMGKSALIERYIDKLHRGSDVLALSGRCYERESVPYKALDSLIDALSHHLSQLSHPDIDGLIPADATTIARLFPVLRRVYAIAGSPSRPEASDPQEMRRRATEALRGLLARMAARQPLVLTIDDFHWGDADSVALLADLLGPPDPPPLMLVVCYRGDEPAGAPRALRDSVEAAGAVALREIALDALSPEDARALALAQLGRDAASTAHADAIARESQGNPFFVAELVRYVQSGLAPAGPLAGGGEPAVGPATRRPSARDSQELPPERIILEDAIRARVAQLRATERALLELIAVAGAPIAPGVLARAACLAPEDYSALQLLRAGHLVRAGTGDTVEPYHDRIRKSVLAGLDADTLRAHHAALAQALKVTEHDDPEALALHYRGAGDLGKAGAFAEKAGDKAAAALAFDRAAEMYLIAIECAAAGGGKDTDPDKAAWELRRKRADALANAGRGAAAADEYLRAARHGNAADVLELRRRAADQLIRAGHVDEGLDALRSVLSVVGMRLADSPQRAMTSLLTRRAQLRVRGFRFKERDPSQISAEDLTRIDICWSAASCLGMIDTIRGQDFQTRHMLLALRAGEPYRIARALAMEALYTTTAGPAASRRTQALLRSARRLVDRIDEPHAMGLVVLAGGMGDYQQGSYRAAFEQFEESAEILRARCTGVAFEIAAARRFGIDALFNLGSIGELCRRVPQTLRDAEQRGDLYGATDMRTGLPNAAWLAADDPARARREAEVGMQRWSRRGFHLQHYYNALALANAALYEGDTGAARAHALQMWPQLRSSMLLRIQAVRLEALLLRARTAIAHAAATGDPDALADAVATARKIERERIGPAAPSAALIRAGVALVRGEPRAARAHAERAIRGFELSDMELMRGLARRLRGAIGAGAGGAQGREGAAEMAEVDAWMRGQSIAAPERFARLFTVEPRAE